MISGQGDMDDPVEVELKLEYERVHRDRLAGSALLDAQGAERKHLIATYFDTPDLRVHSAGYAVRIRKDGEVHVQTVKASTSTAGALFVRGEWERTLDGEQPILDETAGPLTSCVDPATLGKVEPLFITDVERLSGLIERDGATIEYSIDSGEVRAGPRRIALSEIELELKRGSPQMLFDLARNLNEEVPLRLGVRSKSGCGYALVTGGLSSVAKAEPIRLARDMGAADAFTAIAGSCLKQYRLNETLLLETEAVEAVHQARVGLRRLRSAFALFKPLFAGDDHAVLLAAELRWLAGELGAIRDIDVLLPQFEGPRRAALAAIRESHFNHLRNLLESGRVRLLPIEIAEWLAIGSWKAGHQDRRLHEQMIPVFAANRLDLLRKRIRREGRRLARVDDEHRHEVRKDAKKLRYVAEFLASLFPGRKAHRRLEHLLDRLEALQDKLGKLNDMAAAPELLAQLGLDPEIGARSPKNRTRLLGDAEKCFDALINTKRFWRT
ncbi:CYTH and CHAD domain-containing protein [Rhizorhabdus argentea]|uniref:CYTH and CHAD domain-containing protein n=1 Tax=Rhizorhabdus argentea TaxID=1387174 RepID=UPI0030EE3A49